MPHTRRSGTVDDTSMEQQDIKSVLESLTVAVNGLNLTILDLKKTLTDHNIQINENNQKLHDYINTNDSKVEVLFKRIDNIECTFKQDVVDIKNSLSVPQIVPSVSNLCNNGVQVKIKDILPRFNGKNENPIEYLHSLKKIVTIDMSVTHITNIIQSSLSEEAYVWYKVIDGTFSSFGEFEVLFLKKYWSDYIQSGLRENLFNGKYFESSGLSREDYFTRKFSIMQHLTPEIKEPELVKYLSRHFHFDILKSVVIQNISTYSDFNELLQKYDYLDYIYKLRYAPKFENNRKQQNTKSNFRNFNKNYSPNNRQHLNTYLPITHNNKQNRNTHRSATRNIRQNTNLNVNATFVNNNNSSNVHRMPHFKHMQQMSTSNIKKEKLPQSTENNSFNRTFTFRNTNKSQGIRNKTLNDFSHNVLDLQQTKLISSQHSFDDNIFPFTRKPIPKHEYLPYHFKYKRKKDELIRNL